MGPKGEGRWFTTIVSLNRPVIKLLSKYLCLCQQTSDILNLKCWLIQRLVKMIIIGDHRALHGQL